MPQMSPTWWMTIFLYTTFCMLISITILYFNQNLKHKSSNLTTKKINQMNWKW